MMKRFIILFFACAILFAACVQGGESVSAMEEMVVGNPPIASAVEISIVRELIGYIVEMGVTGILVVIVYFLWIMLESAVYNYRF